MVSKKNRLITCAIAAEMLGFSPDYIRRLCLDGKIDAQKIGHDWIFPMSAIANIRRQRKLKDKEE